MDELVILLFVVVGFYFVGVPIWLIILSGRISKLQKGGYGQPSPTPAPQKPQQVAQPSAPPSDIPAAVPSREEAQAPQVRKQVPPKPTRSFEEQVGGHIFQWLGIGALIIALVVFLKWSFDNGIIGETGRVVLGYMLAAGGMVAGDLLRKKYGTWSLAFTGGGALASYVVTWVALHAYNMFHPNLALAIYILTTAMVCLLAGHYKAIALAAFGIIGGLITPLLTGDVGSTADLLFYVLILDLGILALSYFTQWRELNALAFVGTLLWEIFAIQQHDIALSTLIFFAVGFGAIYLLVPALYNIVKAKASEPSDILMLLGNGIG